MQKPKYAAICRLLRNKIAVNLPKATPKIYHAIPVWFIGENAVVGYSVTAKKGVNLLFWNGQSLSEPDLKAAEIQYLEVTDVKIKDLRRWLKKAGRNIWDFATLRKQCKN